jgi:predicted nucleic acid-binding protein
VLRYPRFQRAYGLSEADLLEYAQFLQSMSDLVILELSYAAPLRDSDDLIVLQTAERGEVDVLCTRDKDFYDPQRWSSACNWALRFCAKRNYWPV